MQHIAAYAQALQPRPDPVACYRVKGLSEVHEACGEITRLAPLVSWGAGADHAVAQGKYCSDGP